MSFWSLILFSDSPALAYNCGNGNQQNGHCYAMSVTGYYQPIRGDSTYIETEHIISGNFSGSFLDAAEIDGGSGGFVLDAPGRKSAVSYRYGYEIFDPATGNIIMVSARSFP
jgi:hypothetical protein